MFRINLCLSAKWVKLSFAHFWCALKLFVQPYSELVWAIGDGWNVTCVKHVVWLNYTVDIKSLKCQFTFYSQNDGQFDARKVEWNTILRWKDHLKNGTFIEEKPETTYHEFYHRKNYTQNIATEQRNQEKKRSMDTKRE